MVDGSDDVNDKNGCWTVDKSDDKDGWLGVDVWTVVD